MPRRPQRRKAPRRRPVCSEHTGEIVTHVAMMPARRWTSAIVVRALSAGLSVADSINPADVYVIDGDTIRVAGRAVPLVGFDAPELGSRAHCGLERMLAAALRYVAPASTRALYPPTESMPVDSLIDRPVGILPIQSDRKML